MSDATTSGTALGAVPQAQPSQAQAGLDVINSLFDQQQQISQQIKDTTQAAVMPTASKGIATPNLGNVPQINNAPLDNHPVYSHSQARNQGIANIVLGAASLIGKTEQIKKQGEQKDLAVHIENVLKYTDGINQAQTMLKQDPNNTAAKQVIQQNQDNLNALLNDPKLRKKIGKAFDINFADPSQNNKPEHAALNRATQSYAQQLVNKMPAQFTPNQVAQQKLKILQAQDNAVQAQIKATIPIVTKQMQDQAEADRATQHEQGEDARKQAELDAAAQREKEREAANKLLQQDKDKAAFNRVITAIKMNNDNRALIAITNQEASYQRTMDAIDHRANVVNNLPNDDPKKQAVLRGSYNSLSSVLKDSSNKIANYKAIMDMKGTTDAQKKVLQANIDYELNHQTQLNDKISKIESQLTTGTSDNGQSKNTGSAGSSVAKPTVNGPADDSSADEDKEDDDIINN